MDSFLNNKDSHSKKNKNMETYNLLFLLFVGLFLALWNAIVIKWGLETNSDKRTIYSKAWHRVGWLVRAALAVYVAASYGLFFGWLAVIVLWQLYDIIINVVRGNPAFTTDDKTKHSKMAITMWIAKAVWIAAGSLFLIL